MNETLLMYLVLGISLGWMLHSKKHDILSFFKDHGEEMIIYFVCAGWPLISIALFWINILVLSIDWLMVPIGVSLFGYIAFFFWVTHYKKAENKQ